MKISKNSISILFFLIFYIPFASYAVDGKIETKLFKSYKVQLNQNFNNGKASLLIMKQNRILFKESEIDYHYYFGNHFDPDLNNHDIYSGHDITGNKIPNLIISNWTGGAHCCHSLQIFELGNTFKHLVTVDAQSSDIRLVDLDNDGYPEIEFHDGAIDYLFASYAGSPGGRVVLKFNQDHYEVATHLMAKPIPNQKELDDLKHKINRSFKENNSPNLPFDFLKSLMEFSYTGHFEFALKFADEVWPKEKPGLEKFKQDFSNALRESKYWKKF